MKTVLVDTNVLIGLVDRTDGLHERAVKDLTKLARADLRVTDAVLSECVFALQSASQRGRLGLLVERLPITPINADDPSGLRRDVFAWLSRYADHQPDYADAELCVLSGRDRRLRIWTYDSEFKAIWRTPGGKKPSLVA